MKKHEKLQLLTETSFTKWRTCCRLSVFISWSRGTQICRGLEQLNSTRLFELTASKHWHLFVEMCETLEWDIDTCSVLAKVSLILAKKKWFFGAWTIRNPWWTCLVMVNTFQHNEGHWALQGTSMARSSPAVSPGCSSKTSPRLP